MDKVKLIRTDPLHSKFSLSTLNYKNYKFECKNLKVP